MKNKRIVKILIFASIMIAFSICNSYAAVQITNTTSVLTGKTISEFYDMTKEMKNPGQGLEGTNVDVKMSNNYEWATVSYFAHSSYGYGNEASVTANKGVSVTSNGVSHYSTNGNLTGIMDWGKTYTFTAGIIANWKDNNGNIRITNETVLSNGRSIINFAETSDIDKFNVSTNGTDFSIAKINWSGVSWNRADGQIDFPFSIRQGLFGMCGGFGDWGNPNEWRRMCFWYGFN